MKDFQPTKEHHPVHISQTNLSTTATGSDLGYMNTPSSPSQRPLKEEEYALGSSQHIELTSSTHQAPIERDRSESQLAGDESTSGTKPGEKEIFNPFLGAPNPITTPTIQEEDPSLAFNKNALFNANTDEGEASPSP